MLATHPARWRSVVKKPQMRLLALLFVLASFPSGLFAETKITHLEAVANGRAVTVRFQLQNGFDDPEFVKALQSGLPTAFTYRVELYRKRPNWFDNVLDKATIDVICTYNAVTREYLVNYRRNKKLVRSETFHDVALLRDRMTKIEETDLFQLGRRPHYKHGIRVRAELGRDLFLFVVPRAVATEWRETRVRAAGTP